VAVGYNRDSDSADRFVADVMTKTRPHAASASGHRGNIGVPSDCRRTITEVIDTHGHLDILVNNAGITIDKTVAAMTEDDWHTVLAVNLSGAFFLCQAALAHMANAAVGASSTCPPLSERRATSVRPTLRQDLLEALACAFAVRTIEVEQCWS
jgi:NAD(P)-dependent dehydrogenase (short-subunit alcohol dehydrogenase family)